MHFCNCSFPLFEIFQNLFVRSLNFIFQTSKQYPAIPSLPHHSHPFSPLFSFPPFAFFGPVPFLLHLQEVDGACNINLLLMDQESQEISEIKKYVQSYGRPNDRKAMVAIAISFAYQFLAIALIHLGFGIMGWTIHALNNVRFFIQFHDMAHFSFFESIKTNIFFGKLIGMYTHFPFNSWRDGHNHHHKHFGNLDRLDLSQTILFTKKQYEEMKGVKRIAVRVLRQPIVFFFFTAPLVWFVGLVFTVPKRYGVFSWTFLEKLMSIVVFTWVCPLVGIPALNMWLSIIFAQILGTILFHLQHSVNLAYRQRQKNWNFARAALQGSTFLQVPFLLRPFTNGIEYHHIHHLNTNVPSYIIDACHYDFDRKQNKKWDDYHINRVDLALAFKSLFNVMLDEEKGMLVPFSYGF